jgi:O-antigen ligase
LKIVDRVAFAFLTVFVFTIPWEKSVLIPEVGSIARLLGILAFVAGAVAAVGRGTLRRPNSVLILAGLFVAWSAATWFWSLDAAATARRIRTFVELFGMMWLIWESCRDAVRPVRLMQAYILGAVAASAIAFWRYLHNWQTYYLRYAASGFDPNDFGLVLALAIPFCLYLARREGSDLRWLWLAAAPVAMTGVLLTASRAALIATFAAFAFAVLTWRSADRSFRVVSLALIAALALSLVRFAPAPQRKRLASIPTEITRGTLHDRTRIWKTGFKVLKQHPIVGVGSGAYPKAVEPWLGVPKIAGFQYVAHNTFLSVLVECGAIGAAIGGAAVVALAVFVAAMAPVERALWIAAGCTWTAGVFTLTWEHYKPTWLLLALIPAVWANAWKPGRETL